MKTQTKEQTGQVVNGIFRNLHIIKVKYLGATDTLGNRVKLTSDRLDCSVTLDRAYETDMLQQAVNYLLDNGFDVVGSGEVADGFVVACDTFKEL